MAKIDAILMLDCQDDFFPPEVGGDDIIKEIADTLSAQHLVANFLFFASRANGLAWMRRLMLSGVNSASGIGPMMPRWLRVGDQEWGRRGTVLCQTKWPPEAARVESSAQSSVEQC